MHSRIDRFHSVIMNTTFHEQLKEMGTGFGDYFRKLMADTFFNDDKATNEELLVAHYDPDTVAVAMRYYAVDYVTLGLPLPSWLPRVYGAIPR